MAEDSEEPRAARYLKMAAQMREAAERAFTPSIAADYLELAAKWERLATLAQGRSTDDS